MAVLNQGLIALQAFVVFVLWTHDWIPLGRLNDVAAVRRSNPLRKLVAVTLIQSVPYTIGLALTLRLGGAPHGGFARGWLWVTYVILLVGQLRAWWVPYLVAPDPVRAARYREMFGGTLAFLPIRNGMVPNALHVALHLATIAILIVLAVSQ